MNLEELVEPGLRGESISQEQALQVLAVPDSEVMALVAAAGRVRRRFFGVTVKLNYLVNLKSGMCPENCSYCSQAMGSDAPILRYSWLRPDEVDAQVQAGVQAGASTVCLVASGRGPSKREVAQVAEIVEGIHRNHPDLTVCACLGFVDDAKARQLAESGVTRYNHNLNTAESAYPQICTTHTYADRVRTVQAATAGGLSACCGLIAGMGESPEELVAVTFALRDLGVTSVPVNFLLPFEGTPLAGAQGLTPLTCLRILSMVRLVHPDTEVRAAAGREHHLRSLQPLALELCNSIFLGDYLTSEGQAGAADLAMIADSGFVVEGHVSPPVIERPAAVSFAAGGFGSSAGCSGCDHAGAGDCPSQHGPRIRRRGAGTKQPANA